MRLRRTQGFSLLELILAAIIATLGVAGFFAALSSSRQPVTTNDKLLKAALAGKEFLENIRSQVSADAPDGSIGANDPFGQLSLGAHAARPVGGYIINYMVERSDTADNLSPRKVTLTIK